MRKIWFNKNQFKEAIDQGYTVIPLTKYRETSDGFKAYQVICNQDHIQDWWTDLADNLHDDSTQKYNDSQLLDIARYEVVRNWAVANGSAGEMWMSKKQINKFCQLLKNGRIFKSISDDVSSNAEVKKFNDVVKQEINSGWTRFASVINFSNREVLLYK